LITTDFERGRLTVDSFIRPNRLFTVDHKAWSSTHRTSFCRPSSMKWRGRTFSL
jgi:hypothetical protein